MKTDLHVLRLRGLVKYAYDVMIEMWRERECQGTLPKEKFLPAYILIYVGTVVG